MTNQVEINGNISKYKNFQYFQVQIWTKSRLICSKDCSRTCRGCTFTEWYNSYWIWGRPKYTTKECPCTATRKRKHIHRKTQTGSLFDTATSANGNYSSACVNRKWLVPRPLWMVLWMWRMWRMFRRRLLCNWKCFSVRRKKLLFMVLLWLSSFRFSAPISAPKA